MPLLIIFILFTGISGIIAQVVLLREMLVVFAGNELSIGLILSSWMLLEGLGAFLSGRIIEKSSRKITLFCIIILIFSLFLPISLYITRIIREVFGSIPSESFGLDKIFYSSLIILAPIAIAHGGIFTIFSRLYSDLVKKKISGISSVYIYETIGTMLGGAAFTFFLFGVSSFTLITAISSLNLLFAFLLLKYSHENKIFQYFVLCIFIAGLLLIPFNSVLEKYSVRKQWNNQNVVKSENTAYGNLTVIKNEEQYSFFHNGDYMFAVPIPDIAFVEEYANLPMLIHPKPEEVLFISGGLGGIINEIIKHPVKKIDYAELDPEIIRSAQEFKSPATEKELNDKRVNIQNIDGRLFVKDTKNKYDIVMLGNLDTATLQSNRFFTKEFFCMVKNILKNDGIFVFCSSGSLVYLNPEQKNVNGCLYVTLLNVFENIFIIPGDINIFIGFNSKESVKDVNIDLLIKRLKDRNINTKLISRRYVEYKLDNLRINWFKNEIGDAKNYKINKDFSPVGLLYGLSDWSALFSPWLKSVFIFIEKLHWIYALPFIAVFFLLVNIKRKFILPSVIASTGFAGITYNLILIFAFQTLYGYIYRQIGLLIALLMAGIALGAWIAGKIVDKINNYRFLLYSELLVILFSVILPVSLIFLSNCSITLYMGFLLLSLISGVVVGMQFPLVNNMNILKYGSSVSRSFGLLYAYDLLGGWFGGMISAVVLLPVLGIFNSCIIIIAIKMCTFCSLIIWRR